MGKASTMLMAAMEKKNGAARRSILGRPMAIKQLDAVMRREALLQRLSHDVLPSQVE
jgi:hypothetical protein